MTNINYKNILSYLDENKQKPFVNPNKDGIDENERSRYTLMQEQGETVVIELRKIADRCGRLFGLKHVFVKQWLDLSGTKIKNSFCVNMKYFECADNPISVSIVVEKNSSSARYKVCLDVDNDGASKEIMEKYHTHLDMPIENGMYYVGGVCNKWGNYDSISKPIEIIRDMVFHKELRKVQPCMYIQTANSKTNEEYESEILEAVKKIVPFYKHVIDKEEGDFEMSNMSFDKNMILYGPPGTGKTYSTAIYAVAICDELDILTVKAMKYEDVIDRYRKLLDEGRVAFTTFHQSYGYEEFIEGIKPIVTVDESEDCKGEVQYTVVPGIFKEFCEKSMRNQSINQVADYGLNSNPNIWKVSLEKAGDNPTRKECFEENHIRIGWDQYGENITDETDFSLYGGKNQINAFINRMRIGDIVLSCFNSTMIDAIGVITGEYEWSGEYTYYNRIRKVNWLVKNIKENIMDKTNGIELTQSTVYKMSNMSLSDVLEIVRKYRNDSFDSGILNDNYVFVIDEINRGNISKIFGELITLIEDTKREGMDEQASAILPYSGDKFSVPSNVYILGTMNTADRSIALMDTALRRRFQFVEMMPDANVLRAIGANKVADLDVAEMLEKINERITFLYDREHTIGHAFFTKLANSPTIETLAAIFEKSVIPLLQEYFYEDYQKIQLVLGDNGKQDSKTKFILDEEVKAKKIFKGHIEDVVDLPEKKYTINKAALLNIESYKQII